MLSDRKLLVFGDFVCPFCRLADVVCEELASEGAMVEHAAFELRPPGTPLPTLREPYMRLGWERSVRPMAERLGIEMHFPTLATRTRKAHEAVLFARERGRESELRRAVYDAYWVRAEDIGRIDVLMELGAGAGLDAMELKVALDIDTYAGAVVAEEEAAARLGVGGVPAHVLVEDGAVAGVREGVRPIDELRKWLAGEDDV